MRTTIIVEDTYTNELDAERKELDEPTASVIREAVEEYLVEKAAHPRAYRFSFMKLGRSLPEEQRASFDHEDAASDEYADWIEESSGLAESRRRVADNHKGKAECVTETRSSDARHR